MALSDLLPDLLASGYKLEYLRSNSGRWEAMISRPLSAPASRYLHAVGFAFDADPELAILSALATCDARTETLDRTPAPYTAPAPAPARDLLTLLNLRVPAPVGKVRRLP